MAIALPAEMRKTPLGLTRPPRSMFSKPWAWTIGIALAVAPPLFAQDAPAPTVPSIVTTGEAIVRRAPDQAAITAAVEVRAKAPREAARQNADVMTAMRQRIAAAGIPADAMRTTGYDV